MSAGDTRLRIGSIPLCDATALIVAVIGVTPEVIRHTLDGRMKVAPDGTVRTNEQYLLVGSDRAARPDPVQAAWLYAQMVRWGQAPLSAELLAAAKAVFRPDLFDAALAADDDMFCGQPADGIGAFAGPAFDADDIEAIWRPGP